jgi:hypothetical protein
MSFVRRLFLVLVALGAFGFLGVSEVSAEHLAGERSYELTSSFGFIRPNAETCRTDIFGNVNCTGSVGGSRTSNSCRTDIFGNVNCTGSVGGSRTSKTCRKDIFGNVTCK